jgi:hypothetical protein
MEALRADPENEQIRSNLGLIMGDEEAGNWGARVRGEP